jgi:hypothetical protein
MKILYLITIIMININQFLVKRIINAKSNKYQELILKLTKIVQEFLKYHGRKNFQYLKHTKKII